MCVCLCTTVYTLYMLMVAWAGICKYVCMDVYKYIYMQLNTVFWVPTWIERKTTLDLGKIPSLHPPTWTKNVDAPDVNREYISH